MKGQARLWLQREISLLKMVRRCCRTTMPTAREGPSRVPRFSRRTDRCSLFKFHDATARRKRNRRASRPVATLLPRDSRNRPIPSTEQWQPYLINSPFVISFSRNGGLLRLGRSPLNCIVQRLMHRVKMQISSDSNGYADYRTVQRGIF